MIRAVCGSGINPAFGCGVFECLASRCPLVADHAAIVPSTRMPVAIAGENLFDVDRSLSAWLSQTSERLSTVSRHIKDAGPSEQTLRTGREPPAERSTTQAGVRRSPRGIRPALSEHRVVVGRLFRNGL